MGTLLLGDASECRTSKKLRSSRDLTNYNKFVTSKHPVRYAKQAHTQVRRAQQLRSAAVALEYTVEYRVYNTAGLALGFTRSVTGAPPRCWRSRALCRARRAAGACRTRGTWLGSGLVGIRVRVRGLGLGLWLGAVPRAISVRSREGEGDEAAVCAAAAARHAVCEAADAERVGVPRALG